MDSQLSEYGSNHGIKRPQSLAVDRGLVHAGGEYLEDVLNNATLGAAGPSRILEDFLEDGEVVLVEFPRSRHRRRIRRGFALSAKAPLA